MKLPPLPAVRPAPVAPRPLPLIKPGAMIARPLALPLRPQVIPSRPAILPGLRPALAAPRGQSPPLSLTLTSQDPFQAAEALPLELVDSVLEGCLMVLGRAHYEVNPTYATHFRLPGYVFCPSRDLITWVKSNWGNYDWLADFCFDLAHRTPNHKLTGKMIYFHSPPALGGTVAVNFTTCPIKFL